MSGGEIGTYTTSADLQAAICEAHLEYVTPGAGGRLVRVTLGGFCVLRVEEDAPRQALVTLPQDRALIAFPTRSAAFQVWQDVVMRPGTLMLFGPGASFRHAMSRGGAWAWIVFGRQDVKEWHRALSGRELDIPESSLLVRPHRKAFASLLRFHEQAARLVEKRPTIFAQPEVTRALEQELIRAVVNALEPQNE
jgi:hypothetical protein